ncbi:MAG TPA: hypothetical protein VMV59_07000 [Candidatus Dormibacteraeota bacterium]|nr:hypothetical protein [Candidatus Dormibacteraeota bacterium]
MAIQIGKQSAKIAARGDAPNTGAPGPTPAPVKRVVPAAPDAVSSIRHPTLAADYGQNGYVGRTSTNPGERVASDLAENMRATAGDDVLDNIIARGTARADAEFELQSPQTRTVDASPITPAFGMRSRTAGQEGGKVPASLGATSTAPKDPNG